MPEQGYYRFPTVCNDAVVFVSEDDLWRVPLEGGVARRLTTNQSRVSNPRLSPDGKWLAYSGKEEGYFEIWVMPAEGGTPTRLTYLGTYSVPVGWSADSRNIIFYSSFSNAYGAGLYSVPMKGGEPQELPVGHANAYSEGPKKGCVIGRHTRDGARWKRYRGGTAGELWIDTKGKGKFVCLQPDLANVSDPMWIGERIYFLSDHEGYGNLYSCLTDGEDLQRHTDHDEFYARNASTDGKTVVYHAGADIYAYDVASCESRMLAIDYLSNFAKRARKYVGAVDYLQGYDIHPGGAKTAVAVRGHLASLSNWSGPVNFHGKEKGVRYRMPTWLQDGKHLLAISDEIDGEDRILTVDITNGKEKLLDKIWPGRVRSMIASPKANLVAISNHRNELLLLDIDKKKMTTLDVSDTYRIHSLAWSPDGRWLAYGFFNTKATGLLRVVEIESGRKHDITQPILTDSNLAWSPCGKYIYFVGERNFNPVYDSLQFHLAFIKADKIYALPLTKDAPDPFQPKEQSPAGDDKKDDKRDEKTDDKDKKEDIKVEIDFEGIERRVVPFPVPVGDYYALEAHDKRLYFLLPKRTYTNKDYQKYPKSDLLYWDFEKQAKDTLYKDVYMYRLSFNGKTMIVRRENGLSVYKTGAKPAEKPKNKYSMESGDIDMGRIRPLVNPIDEWRQMYREAWLLQREHFWVSDMSGIDWELIYKRYLPLLDRLGSRSEFSDLIWEMQGELGTSHCYEFGGDYKHGPHYGIGKLGCDYELASSGEYWKIRNIRYGDSSETLERSPLLTPGANIEEGDNLLAINGRPVDKDHSPRERLLNLGGQEVTLTIRKDGKRKTREVTVRTLKFEYWLLYREWVEKNRRYVHEQSKGRVGYVHIPNMGWDGFAEFHRLYLSECQYDALLVDVRYNGGGHVSQLLLEKLARKPIGFDKTRWTKTPDSFPNHTVNGPICALTNEFAGSDGDIFSHSFKLLGLGKLIGKRTWGGVIGINSQYSLTDGAVTTQPEYSFWFKDVGWGVENYGTDPDIEVDITPQDYVAGRDPQLDTAIEHLLEELKTFPRLELDESDRPNLALPKLPKR